MQGRAVALEDMMMTQGHFHLLFLLQDGSFMATAKQFAGLVDIKLSHNAAVHGVLFYLPPVKTSKMDSTYFNMQLPYRSV